MKVRISERSVDKPFDWLCQMRRDAANATIPHVTSPSQTRKGRRISSP
jgi:hypothetical protein